LDGSRTTCSSIGRGLTAFGLLIAIGITAISCNYSAGTKKSSVASADCRDIKNEKKASCYLGENGTELTITRTFTTAASDQVWTDEVGDFSGFSLTFAAQSFTAPMTVTVKLFLSKTSGNSYLDINGDRKLSDDFTLITPSLVRSRFEASNFRDIVIVFADAFGTNLTLGGELTYTSEGNIEIRHDKWGQYSFNKAKEPPLTSIKLQEEDTTIIHKQTAQIKVIGVYTDESEKEITSLVQWEMENPTLATLKTDATEAGTFKGEIPGTTAIAASYRGIKGLGTLTVSDPVVVDITITPADAEIARGDTQAFTALAKYSDDTEKDITKEASWKTASTDILTVVASGESGGLATGVEVGETYIIASSGEVSSQVPVKVIPPELESIAIDQQNNSHPHTSTFPFTATGTYKDGSTKDITSEVTWSSSDTNIAEISNSPDDIGLATTKNVGETTITATLGEISGDTTFTVVGQAAVALAFRVQPTGFVGGLVINPNIEVIGVDAAGHFDPSFSATITLTLTTLNPAANEATLRDAEDTEVTADTVDGVATFGSARVSFAAGDAFANAAQHNGQTPTFRLEAAASNLPEGRTVADVSGNQISPIAPFGAGDNGSTSPYKISNLTDLDAVRLFLGSKFILNVDLDATSTAQWNGGLGFLPFGYTYPLPATPSAIVFSGEFDGNGKTILGLTILTQGLSANVGLFAKSSGSIKNLSLRNIYVDAPALNNAGGLSGEHYTGTIENVMVTGTVNGKWNVGGIAGMIRTGGILQKATAITSVSGEYRVGGVIGRLYSLNGSASSTLSQCAASVTVQGSLATGDSEVGGLVGSMSDATLTSCAVMGTATGPSAIGGAVGSLLAGEAAVTVETTISKVTSLTNVTATGGTAGGLIGKQGTGSISHAIAGGNVSSTSTTQGKVGGFAGAIEGTPQFDTDASVSYAAASGNVYAGANPVGGFVGLQGSVEIGQTHTHEISYVGTSAVLGTGSTVEEEETGAFAGRNNKADNDTSTISQAVASKRHSNPTTCVGTDQDSAATTCRLSSTLYDQHAAGLKFARSFQPNRKVSRADQANYQLAGLCPIRSQGKTVYVDATDGSKSLSSTTTCRGGLWSSTLNLQSLADGPVMVTIELEDSCTLGSSCPVDELSLDKSTASCSATSGTPFQSGSGTSLDPYLICSSTQLAELANHQNSALYFRLGNNLDLTTAALPITNAATPFIGHLDGNGHVLRNGACHAPGSDYCGLFAKIGSGGTVRNLTLERFLSLGQNYVGLIAGESTSNGTFENLALQGLVVASADRSGLLAGSAADGQFSSVRAVGGVVGQNEVGGMIGIGSNLDLIASGSHVHVVGTGTNHGSAVGSAANGSSFDRVFATGSIISTSGSAGGLAGRVNGGSMINSYATGFVISTGSSLGGLVGLAEGGLSVTKSYASGAIIVHASPDTHARGGLVGTLRDNSVIDTSFATTLVAPDSSNYAGTLVGLFGVAGQTGSADIISSNILTQSGNPAACYGSSSTQSLAQNSNCSAANSIATLPMLSDPQSSSWNFSSVWQEVESYLPLLRDILD
jgi:hypothetical protein